MERYNRKLIQNNPDTFFVFGDNLARTGLGGQAKEARGEPNAIGVVTKRKPSNTEDSFFSDTREEMIAVAKDIRKIKDLLDLGYNVVFPYDGIGTGLAKLPEKSPKIFSYIEQIIEEFKITYGMRNTL